MNCKIELDMRVKDFPLAVKWLKENYPQGGWTVGTSDYHYKPQQISLAIQEYDLGYYEIYDEEEYRNETVFYFADPQEAMFFKLIWA